MTSSSQQLSTTYRRRFNGRRVAVWSCGLLAVAAAATVLGYQLYRAEVVRRDVARLSTSKDETELRRASENLARRGEFAAILRVVANASRQSTPALRVPVQGSYPVTRLSSMLSGFRLADRRVVRMLLDRLDDEDPEIQSCANTALLHVDSNLLIIGLRHPSPTAREMATRLLPLSRYLGYVGSAEWKSVTVTLKSLAAADPDPAVRRIAREALDPFARPPRSGSSSKRRR